MALCRHCKTEMNESNSCIRDKIVINNKQYMPITYGNEKRAKFNGYSERCHDCNVTIDGYHHLRCDVEECPKCECPLISCGCMEK